MALGVRSCCPRALPFVDFTAEALPPSVGAVLSPPVHHVGSRRPIAAAAAAWHCASCGIERAIRVWMWSDVPTLCTHMVTGSQVHRRSYAEACAWKPRDERAADVQTMCAPLPTMCCRKLRSARGSSVATKIVEFGTCLTKRRAASA